MSGHHFTPLLVSQHLVRRRLWGFTIAIFLFLLGAPIVSSLVIEYQRWREMKAVPMWTDFTVYTIAPVAIATLLTFGVFRAAHAAGMKFAGIRLGSHPLYARVSAICLLFSAGAVAAGGVDTWTVVRYFGGWTLPVKTMAWRDTVFGLPMDFYVLDLPFYAFLQGFVAVLAVAAGLVYWLTARGWQLHERFSELEAGGRPDISALEAQSVQNAPFFRGVTAVFLLALAFRFFLGRYEMVLKDHNFMFGVGYWGHEIALPLQWMVIAACVTAGVFVTLGRWKLAAWMALVLIIRAAGPSAAGPNEIPPRRPYLQKHFEATRSACWLDRGATETEVAARIERKV